MSSAGNHRKRSHRSHRLHYRRRAARTVAAPPAGSRRWMPGQYGSMIRKIVSRPPERAKLPTVEGEAVE